MSFSRVLCSFDSHQRFLLTESVDGFQVGIAVQGVRVHAVLKGLHLLDDFLQGLVFDAHVVHGVQQGNPVWETFLHLLESKSSSVD